MWEVEVAREFLKLWNDSEWFTLSDLLKDSQSDLILILPEETEEEVIQFGHHAS